MNKTLNNCTFTKDGVEITYCVEFSKRRSVSIQIKGVSGDITVKLPTRENLLTAQKLVDDKFDWIIKSINKVNSLNETRNIKSYTDGSTHLVLGVPYTLNIVNQKGNSVRIEDNNLLITTEKSEKVELLLKRWYTEQARNFLIPLTAEIASDFSSRHRKSPSSLELKFVKSYWGVCTSRGVIKLNIELMRAPAECIKYIIIHELCHLIHQNHSKRFYDLLSLECPNWKESKKILEKTISCRS